MDIEISEDILKKTTKCGCNFSCLTDEKKCLCEVKGSAGYNSVCVSPQSDMDCDYINDLGSSFFCFCPTRNEIYHRYNI